MKKRCRLWAVSLRLSKERERNAKKEGGSLRRKKTLLERKEASSNNQDGDDNEQENATKGISLPSIEE